MYEGMNEMAISGTQDSSLQSMESNEINHDSDLELMVEKYAKLLLGEDMSGGGKGVSSALALSNAITNLAASAFAQQKRLEPMIPEMKERWRKEVDWLLSITDYIVEFVPSKQKAEDGSIMDVMITRQRIDLLMNIPALRKLDDMLIRCLDNFEDQNEFYYISKDEVGHKAANDRKDDKWWIPTPLVPPNGLSAVTRKWLQFEKESMNQVLKAAMAINAQVLAEMEIPNKYIENLPKNGRATLGDAMYKRLTDDYFDPHTFLTYVDLSSEHRIVDLKNRIEASIEIWKRKKIAKDVKSSWGLAVSMEKRGLFEERAETILLIIKQRFPGLPQSQLEMSKIQFNRDVGQAILESYSRTIETMASKVMSRIDDVLHADTLAMNACSAATKSFSLTENEEDSNSQRSMNISDFMCWAINQPEGDVKKDYEFPKDGNFKMLKSPHSNKMLKSPPSILTSKRMSYLENLGASRSPASRR